MPKKKNVRGGEWGVAYVPNDTFFQTQHFLLNFPEKKYPSYMYIKKLYNKQNKIQ